MDGAIIKFQIADDHSFERLKAVVDAIDNNTFPWEDAQGQWQYFAGHSSFLLRLGDEDSPVWPPGQPPAGPRVTFRELIQRLRETRAVCETLSCSREPDGAGCVATDPYAYPVDNKSLEILIGLFGHKVE